MSLVKQTIVALPAYNEEASIGQLLNAFRKLAADHPELGIQVLVVNDGSSDRTLEVVDSFRNLFPLDVVSHEKNRGLGKAIKTCLRESIARSSSDDDVIVTLDADNTHLPEYIPLLVEKIRSGYDIAIASRYQPGSLEVGVPFIRRLYSRGARFLFRIFLHLPGVKDYTCGYRAYRAGLISKGLRFFQDDIISRNGFACTDELLVNLASLTDKIAEIPFILRYDQKKGKSKLPLFSTIMETWKLLLFRKPVGANVRDHRSLIQQSRLFVEARCFKDAEERLCKARDLAPENPAVPLFLGILRYESGDYEEALRCFDDCLLIEPVNQLARNFRALSLYRAGRKKESLKEFSSQWLEQNSDFLSRFCSLFEKELLTPPIDAPPLEIPLAGNESIGDNADSRKTRRLFSIAVRSMEKKDFKAASTLFQRILEHNPDHVSALYGYALVLMESARYRESQRLLLDYFERKSGNLEPPLVVLLGRIYILLGKFEAGIRILKTVPLEGPEDYCVHYNLGLGYLFQGDEMTARSFFKKAFRYYFVDTWEDCIKPLQEKIRSENA
jgi:dolichol-phosphate mannosyltransferase